MNAAAALAVAGWGILIGVMLAAMFGWPAIVVMAAASGITVVAWTTRDRDQ